MEFEFIMTQDALDRMAKQLASAPCIGLDLECASNIHRYARRICLIQLATQDEAFIVDVMENLDLKPIQDILKNTTVEIIMHDTDFDLRSLDLDYGWRPNNLFDTLVAARLCGHKKFGLASLLEHFFNVKGSKSFQRADWTKRPLSEDMLHYAAADVEHLIALRDLLAEELEKVGRMEWARAIFLRCEDKRFEPDERALFERVKRARRSCDGRQLAIVQELAIARDDIARELDLPHFRVFRDEILLALALKPPDDTQALASIRGLHPRCRNQYANRLIEAIRRGKKAPKIQWPRKKHSYLSPEGRRLLKRLKEWRDNEAIRLGVDADIIISKRSLARIASGDAIDTVLLDEPINAWQGDRIARELRNLVSKFK